MWLDCWGAFPKRIAIRIIFLAHTKYPPNFLYLTVLIDKHSNGYARHIKSIKEILYRWLHSWFYVLRVFEFNYSLSHCLYYISLVIITFIRIILMHGIRQILTCLSRMCVNVEQNSCKFVWVGSVRSNSITSSKLFAYHVLTSPTDSVLNKLSGSKAISFMMFAKRTGSSFLKKIKDFFSHAFIPIFCKRERIRDCYKEATYAFILEFIALRNRFCDVILSSRKTWR